MSDTLNPRENAFCCQYIIDRNITQAAVRAGYSKTSAHTTGWRLMQKAAVQARIAELEQEIADRAGLTAVLVREEIRRLATFDPARLYDDAGRLKSIWELPEEVRACISAIDYDIVARTNESGETVYVQVVDKLRFWNKNQALELGARITGLVKDPKLQLDMNPLTELLERIGKNGSGLPYVGTR